jgi:pimeloyl-ACP methyl ester carboxylesterase
MTVKAHVLFGGLSTLGDGVVTSRGMYWLADRLRALPGVDVATYQWADFQKARQSILFEELDPKNKIALIGYSGGGSRATYIASMEPQPKIDLLVLYDPSPKWQMAPIYHNVKKAICYQNSWPLMFGLGGGKLVAHNSLIEIIPIAQQHLAVQFNPSLHARTIAAVKALAS